MPGDRNGTAGTVHLTRGRSRRRPKFSPNLHPRICISLLSSCFSQATKIARCRYKKKLKHNTSVLMSPRSPNATSWPHHVFMKTPYHSSSPITLTKGHLMPAKEDPIHHHEFEKHLTTPRRPQRDGYQHPCCTPSILPSAAVLHRTLQCHHQSFATQRKRKPCL